MSFVTSIVTFLGDIRVHRGALAVAAILVGLQGGVQTNGHDLGLDDASVQTAVGAIGVIVAAAREVADPVLLKFLFRK
jgi:hypothetical protein